MVNIQENQLKTHPQFVLRLWDRVERSRQSVFRKKGEAIL